MTSFKKITNMFNFKRFIKLFSLDFQQNKKDYLLIAFQTSGMVIALYVILKFFGINDENLTNVFITIFNIFFIIYAIIISVNSNKSVNNSLENIFYFTLPISTMERFLFILIKFLLIFPILFLILYFALINFSMLIDNLVFREIKIDYIFKEIYTKSISDSYLNYFGIFPLFLIGSIIFKKNPIAKTFTILIFFLISLGALITGMAYLIIVVMDINIFKVGFDAIIENPGKVDLSKYFPLLSLFLYIGSYFKIEEYELKN